MNPAARPSFLRSLVGTLAGRAAAALPILLGRSAAVEAGGHGKRWPGLPARRPASAVLAAAPLAGARGAWLALNSPHGAAIVSGWVSNLIGDGPSVRPVTASRELRRKLVALWDGLWTDCDADGELPLDAMLQALARTLIIQGEFFLLMVAGEDGRLRLRMIAPDQVDRALNREIGSGARIVAGIEFDAQGRRVAFHVRENQDVPFAASQATRRVPAADMVHVFEVLFPGQVRGLSWLAPSATRLADIAKLEDALLAKFNTSALFGGIMKKPNSDATPVFATDEAGNIALEPGGIATLPPGYDYENVEPPGAEGASDFLRSQIRSAAVGAGLPYELVSGDLSQVNYSSARLGLMEFRRRVVAVQKSLIVGRLLNRVWTRLLLLEGLAGRLDMGAALATRAEFVFTGWAPIDPLKEAQADALAIASRTKSRFQIIATSGRDPEAVDAEIAQDAFAPSEAPAIAKEQEGQDA